jgi:hypothetical protein
MEKFNETGKDWHIILSNKKYWFSNFPRRQISKILATWFGHGKPTDPWHW